MFSDLGTILEAFWSILGYRGVILGACWNILNYLGFSWEHFGGILGLSWWHLGTLLEHLGLSWAILGLSWPRSQIGLLKSIIARLFWTAKWFQN